MSAQAQGETVMPVALEAAPRPRSNRAEWALPAVALAAFVLQVLATDDSYTALTKVYSGLLAALTGVAVVRVLLVRPPRMPMIELTLVFHYVTFGLAATAGPSAVGVLGIIPKPEAYESAAALALAGAMAMLAGHALWRFRSARTTRRRYMPDLTADTLVAASAIYVPLAAASVVLVTAVQSVRAGLYNVLAIVLLFVDLVPLATVATLAYALRPRARTLGQLVVAVGASGTVVAITSMLSTGTISTVATVAVWWRVRGRIPIVFVGCAIALVLVLQPVKAYYRSVMWDGNGERVTVIDGWQEAFSRARADRDAKSGGESTRERLSDLGALAYVMDLVPRSVDYMGGDAYGQTLIASVPRILWPDKPNMTKAGLDRYVIELGLSTPEAAEHSTTQLQLVTHGYASHGVFGAIGWLALFGFAVGAVQRFFGYEIAGTIASTVFMVGWGWATGEGFVNCFGSLWQVVFGTLMLVWLLRIIGGVSEARRDARIVAPMRGARVE